MGSFGLFKKLKDKMKQIKPWIRKVILIARNLNQVKSLVQKITKDKPRFKKVNDLLSITDDGLNKDHLGSLWRVSPAWYAHVGISSIL